MKKKLAFKHHNKVTNFLFLSLVTLLSHFLDDFADRHEFFNT